MAWMALQSGTINTHNSTVASQAALVHCQGVVDKRNRLAHWHSSLADGTVKLMALGSHYFSQASWPGEADGTVGRMELRVSVAKGQLWIVLGNANTQLNRLEAMLEVYRLEAMLESDRLQASLSEHRLQQMLADERLRSDRMRAMRDGMAVQRCACSAQASFKCYAGPPSAKSIAHMQCWPAPMPRQSCAATDTCLC
eukprot:1161618-Pelagomonas_calceolata.AAC.6